MRNKQHYQRFFKGSDPISIFLRWWGGGKKPARYANVPMWVQKEAMQKAQKKREMRARKRLEGLKR